MPLTFSAERHVAPASRAAAAAPLWSEDAARREVAAIVEDCEACFDPVTLWPEHPLEQDRDVADGKGEALTSLFLGATGTIWALRDLASAGLVRLRHDYGKAIDGILARHATTPDFAVNGKPAPGLLLGDLGVHLVAALVRGAATDPERVKAAAAAAIPAPELELMWGAAGALLVARHFARTTPDPAWRKLMRTAADRLLATWKEDPKSGAWTWEQDLYGNKRRYLGAVHGFAGNAEALLAAGDVLTRDESALVLKRVAATLKSLAIREDGAGSLRIANWPLALPEGAPTTAKILLQYCHGAPGIVAAMARYPKGEDSDLDTLLEEAGECIWQAGPLAKPHGLCHGTAGNGYAFLVLHRRTGDSRWLARAREFATVAVAQSHAARGRFGMRRHTFWQGDLGLAVYLGDLLLGRGHEWPQIERF
jgi:hypothetical protein